MSTQPDFYRSQAESMRRQAETAGLANVRERCLRSAEAWEQMADRAERHQRSVAKTEALKAAAALAAAD